MKVQTLNEMFGGWFVGNFEPSILKTEAFEACVKRYTKGEREPRHYQLISVEITVIISGRARLGTQVFETNDVILIEPGEEADFEALEDTVLLAVKTPSIPKDKRLVN